MTSDKKPSKIGTFTATLHATDRPPDPFAAEFLAEYERARLAEEPRVIQEAFERAADKRAQMEQPIDVLNLSRSTKNPLNRKETYEYRRS